MTTARGLASACIRSAPGRFSRAHATCATNGTISATASGRCQAAAKMPSPTVATMERRSACV